jgi:hypothetical protein
MAISVSYGRSLPYSIDEITGRKFPGIEVVIHGPERSRIALAHIDTGADYCCFDGVRARFLGLDLFSGRRMKLVTAAGFVFESYLHEVDLEFLGKRVLTVVGFSTHPLRREQGGGRTSRIS